MLLTRTIDVILLDWKKSHSRKPLLVRGMIQVGKFTSVRTFRRQFEHFLEVNFETEKEIYVFFEGTINVKTNKRWSVIHF